ncbi:MAG TPA: glycosyltransferase family 2 protein, partial [Gammaproteobacteria bacterium]
VGGYAEVLREWVEAGLAPERLLIFDHPHNEFLSVLASRGLAGLFALLLVFGIPLSHFAWGVRHPDRDIAGLSYAGIMLIAGFAIFGLSEAIFERTMPITFYVFCLAVIYGLVRSKERQFLGQAFKRDKTLSVIIITLNEADRIRSCLESVYGWADEIIVLDSGSTDGTVGILREYTDKVWVTDWPGFGKQKQRALDRANGEWVLSIDADERVTPELRAEIDHTLRGRPAHTGYDVHRPVVLFGRIMDFSGSGQSPLRLFDRSAGAFTQVPVHERVDLKSGTLGRLRGALFHETYRDYNHAVTKFAEYSWLQANERYRKGKRSRLFAAALRGILNFIYNYFLRLGFLDGGRGFILAALHANYTFNKYAALWEIALRESHELRGTGVDRDTRTDVQRERHSG